MMTTEIRMSRAELLMHIDIAWPGVWWKYGEAFDEQHAGSIWTGCGSHELRDVEGILVETPVFDSYAMSGYHFGVLQSFNDWLEERGWYAEAYDAETFFLYRIYGGGA